LASVLVERFWEWEKERGLRRRKKRKEEEEEEEEEEEGATKEVLSLSIGSSHRDF